MSRSIHPILCVITARGGSKGLPGKNIKELDGKPLIAYSIHAAKRSRLITRTIVSTDDEQIADVARRYGGEVPFLRLKELAEDDTPHLPVIQHAIGVMENLDGITYEYAVIFQPTSPFRTPASIDGTIQKLMDTGADSIVTVCEIEGSHHPCKAKRLDGDLLLPYTPGLQEIQGIRRQDLPVAYRRNGAVYAMKRDTLMKKNSLYGDTTVAYVMPKELSVDIDGALDWVRAESMLAELKRQGYTF